jgi:hypothetical protein
MGLYLFMCCKHWGGLKDDIPRLRHDLISLVAVTSPFHGPTMDDLDVFDFSRPYKEHYFIDLENVSISTHHRRNVDKALEQTETSVSRMPVVWGDEWVALYDNLITRHGIQGLTKFSHKSLMRQLAVPGATIVRATHGGDTACMLVWYTQGDVAYYHLGASSERGYDLRASYAAFWASIEHFKDKVKTLSLGAGAGVEDDPDNGLTRFKRGWSNGTMQTYLCGKVLDRKRYDKLSRGKREGFFPAYRGWTA